jgi:hypothetical protein
MSIAHTATEGAPILIGRSMRPAVDLNLINITPSFWLSATPILPARTPSAISFSGPSGAVGELGEAGA